MAHGSEVEKLERRWMENPMGVTFAPLAEAYRRAGDQSRALEVLAIGLTNHPAYVPALIVQARCHLDVRADGAAEESFLAVLATDGHNLIALKGLADICERSDRPEQAQKHLDRLLEADPTHDDGRAQMDRVTTVLAERERLRGPGNETAGLQALEASVAAAAALEAAEPMGFEPTDAGIHAEKSALDERSLPAEPTPAFGRESAPDEHASESLPEGPEPELIETVGWAAGEVVEPVAGFEATEPDFVVEKETAPFDAFDVAEADSPAASPVPSSEDSAVPFEEELPAPWLETHPDEPVADTFRDEVSVEPAVESEVGAEEADVEVESPVAEPEAWPDPGASIWAPMGSAWSPADGAAPPDQAAPLEDLARADESPWAETTAAEPVIGAEGATEPPEAVLAWEPPAEVQEDLPATDPSPTARDAEDADTPEPAEWQVPASEATPTAQGLDDEVTVVEGAESELPTDSEPEIEPALIMTETMARLFERQGHRTMALAIYAQLAEQEPGNPELAAAVERLRAELSASSASRGAMGMGAVAAAAVDAIVGRGPSIPAETAHADSEPLEASVRLDAPATRASEDLFSLSAVFGPARPVPAARSTVFSPGSEDTQREPSFDEFFGGEGTAATDRGQAGPAGGEDLEQFTAWLRSLKR